MWFLVLKLLKTGFSQAKKHRAAKKQQQQQQQNDPNTTSINLDPTTKTGATESATEMLSFNANTTRNPAKSLLDASLRLLQFVLGLVVIGLYGQHLTLTSDKTAAEHGYSPLDARWLYAVITGALASLTALVYMVLMFALRKRTPLVRRTGLLLPVFVWEGVVWVLWLVCFGIFGRLFLAKQHGGGEGRSEWEEKMWRAVWVDLASWVVWGVSLVWCGVRWWKRGGLGSRSGDGDGSGADVEKGSS